MPIKWDAANELQLLLKVLEQHPRLQIDVDKISKTWPSDANERPTKRAVGDRLNLLKARARGKKDQSTKPLKATARRAHPSKSATGIRAPATPSTLRSRTMLPTPSHTKSSKKSKMTRSILSDSFEGDADDSGSDQDNFSALHEDQDPSETMLLRSKERRYYDFRIDHSSNDENDGPRRRRAIAIDSGSEGSDAEYDPESDMIE